MANDGAIPFNTQFFMTTTTTGLASTTLYDGDGMPDGDAMPVDADLGERDLLSETQGSVTKSAARGSQLCSSS